MIVSCIKPKRVNLERIKELREKNNLTKSKMAQVDELPVLSEIFHVKIEKFFE